jgi:hypothetical protein
VQLILTFQHPKEGPRVIVSFPRTTSDSIITHIFRILKLHEKEVSITDLVDETPAIHQIFFIPSAKQDSGDKLMISAILKKKIDSVQFMHLITEPTERIRSLPDLYKILYANESELRKDPSLNKKMNILSDILANVLDKIRDSLEAAKPTSFITV